MFFPSFAGRIKKLHPQAEKEDGGRLHRPRFNVSFIARLLYYDIIAERPGPILQPQGATRISVHYAKRKTNIVRREQTPGDGNPRRSFFHPVRFVFVGGSTNTYTPHIPCGYGCVCTRDDNNTLSFSLAP